VRLELPTRCETPFSDDAALTPQTARGLPRAVNNLAICTLIATFASCNAIVDQSGAHWRHRGTEV
jgi:hypothetical protein